MALPDPERHISRLQAEVVARGLQIAPEGLAGLRTPIGFSRSPLALDRAAPMLGTGDWAFSATDRDRG